MKKTINKSATTIANEILRSYAKLTLSEELGISRPTLDTRLMEHNWKVLEVQQLNRIHDRLIKRQRGVH